MAGVQDPLTDLPPPSRFDFDELSNFTFDVEGVPQNPSSPSQPVISWEPSTVSIHGEGKAPLRTSTLLIATSAADCHLIQNLNHKVCLGWISTSTADSKGQMCSIYALEGDGLAFILVSVSKSVAEELAYTIVKTLMDAIAPDRVVITAALQREHFRGKLSADDRVVFRLETDKERLEKEQLEFPYFPSGSVVSGLPAAVLTRCQIRSVKARLLVYWPDAGSSAPSFLSTALGKLKETKSIDFGHALLVPFKGKAVSDLDIYF